MGLGKLTRKGYANYKSVFPSSAFLKSNSNTFHHRSISEYSVISRSQLWKICTPNSVVSGRMIQKGFFPNPVLGSRFFSNALWKGRTSIPVTIRNTRFFNSFKSLDTVRRSSFFKRLATDGVTISLIVANVAVFLLWKVADTEFMEKNFMVSVDNFNSARLHTMITSAFTHHDTFHFVTNMIGLYFFGTRLGRCSIFGQHHVLKLYLYGALTGSFYYLAYHAFIAPLLPSDHPFAKAPAQGASGAMDAIVVFGTLVKLLNITDYIIPASALLLGFFIVREDVLRVSEGDTGFAQLGGITAGFLAILSLII